MSVQESTRISRPPSGLENGSDRAFRFLTYAFGLLTIGVVLFIVFQLGRRATPAFEEFGLGFLTGATWDPNQSKYGILPEIWGTLYTSLFALLIGSLFGVAVAIFLSEGYLGSFVFYALTPFGLQFKPFWRTLPARAERAIKTLVELLAAIPSVVYGLWGIYVVIPALRPLTVWCNEHLGWIPFFRGTLGSGGVLPASLVLAIMILPTIAAISREALVAVPPRIREAAYGLGATRWETIFGVLLPTAAGGIFGSIILAFGRALGETMALAMLVGNNSQINLSVFAPANTLAALLANNFSEASRPLEIGVLMYAALVLMAITLVVNMFGAAMLGRAAARSKGAKH